MICESSLHFPRIFNRLIKWQEVKDSGITPLTGQILLRRINAPEANEHAGGV